MTSGSRSVRGAIPPSSRARVRRTLFWALLALLLAGVSAFVVLLLTLLMQLGGTTLAAVVGDLLADPTTRTTMGASGRKAVDDNRGAVARLMQFLEPLLP